MAGPSDESRQELVRLLAEARQAKNLSIRACAKLAGVPAATAQGWLNGRHLPTPALRDNFEQLLRALELDIPKSSWRPETRSSAEADPAARAPYLGLRSYGRADADLFWGRDAQAKRLAELIADMPDRRGIVALVGGSGSGKSSLLAAGLVAGECSSGILAGWRAVLMPVDALTTETQAELVVIDQFEELLTGDPDTLSAALDTVESLAASSCVVIGLRSDAYAAAALQPALMSALERPVLISEMTRDELTEAIVRPAEAVGVNVEPELVRAFLDDLAPRGVRGALVTQALRRRSP